MMKKRSNKPLSLFVQVISLLSLISLNSYSYTDQTAGSGGVNILQSVGSCSGVSSSGSLSGSEDSSEESSGNFITGEPFDIPAPIAKGSEGIDPTSIEFTSGSGGRVIKEVTTANTKEVLAQTSDATAGTLSFSTIDGVSANVAIIIDGVVDRTVETTDGLAETDISEDELDIPIGLAVINGTPEAIESFDSSIPIVTINSPTGMFEDFTVSIKITNVDEDTDDPDGLTGFIIGPDTLAYSEAGRVAFSAEANDGTPFVGTVVLDEGVPEVLTDDPPNELGELVYSASLLVGVDRLEGYIYRIDSDGVVLSDDFVDLSTVPTERNFCISPDKEWLASNNIAVGQMTLTLFNMSTTENILVPSTFPEPPSIANITCDWVDNENLVLIKEYDDATFGMELYNVTGIMEGTETAVTPITIIPPDVAGIKQPKVDPNDTSRIAYLCDMTPGQTDLCIYDPVNQVSVLYDAGAGNVVTGHNWVEGLVSSAIIFEIDMSQGNTDDLENHAIVIVHADSGDFDFLAPGMKPTPSPTGDTSVVYLSPLDSALQVSVMTLR